MSFPDDAQRASGHPRRWHRIGAITLAAMLCAGSVALTDPLPGAAATSTRVAIIVGPAGSQTTANRAWADAAAREALKYTANVVKVYTPNATWSKVKAAMTGASVVVYVGRGSGFPSVSSSVLKPATHNGFGLNPVAGRGSSATRYYGETYIRAVKLAPKAVVLLHRTDYASGWSPSGYAQPSLSVARRRVDNYGAGFLAAGASAVIAEYSTSPAYYVRAIFTQSTSLASVWNGAAAYHGHVTSFTSTRTRSATGRTDPISSGAGYTRSIVGWPSTRTSTVRLEPSSPAPSAPTPTASPVPVAAPSGQPDAGPPHASADCHPCADGTRRHARRPRPRPRRQPRPAGRPCRRRWTRRRRGGRSTSPAARTSRERRSASPSRSWGRGSTSRPISVASSSRPPT